MNVKNKKRDHLCKCTAIMAAVIMAHPHSVRTPSLTVNSATVSFLPSKLFKVKNVDDKGRIIHVGYLEVTDTDVIFTYEHYPSEVTKWPLTCIRKYGVNVDGNVFALEAGRRAPTGEGLFAFRSDEASDIRQRIDYYIHAQER